LHVTWSTSPKLSISGETQTDALVPEALATMNRVKNSFLYTKFVVRDKQCFAEVDHFVDQYKQAGVGLDAVFCMPEGATLEQQSLTARGVADVCLQTGYKYSPRLHVDLFENSWGT
jgi:7-carboxy-7-deazaguanine synthase